MGLFLRVKYAGAAGLSLLSFGIPGQESNLRAPLAPLAAWSMPQSTVVDELQVLAQQAGVIFVGQVLAIHAPSSLGMSTGWVQIDFRVDQAIRGCAGQATYVLREWAGLWVGGLQRYRVGQQLLMLLHTPSASGLSSPVGGQDGAIPIGGSASAASPLSPDDASITTNEQGVDMRWLETRLLRTSGQRLHRAHALPLETALSSTARSSATERRAPEVRNNARFESGRLKGAGFMPAEVAVEGSMTPMGPETTPLRAVLAMLGAWESLQAHAAR
jgi:hypothetical protein